MLKPEAVGTPGLLLSGIVHTIPNRKGGPLGNPDGYLIPSSGTLLEPIGLAVNDFYGYGVDATLTDQSGAIIASNSAVVTAHSC